MDSDQLPIGYGTTPQEAIRAMNACLGFRFGGQLEEINTANGSKKYIFIDGRKAEWEAVCDRSDGFYRCRLF